MHDRSSKAMKTRVLLVDDEKRILQTFSMMLKDVGYYVKTATGPEGALTLIAEERFDIVFLDQFLGPVKGTDLMQEMREMDPGLYFVIITANGSADLAVQSLKKGASDFITKPFFIADIVRSIDYVNKKRGFDKQRGELIAALESKVSEKTEELKGVYLSVLSTLAQAMEKKDLGTYGHCRRVSFYARLIAAALDLDKKESEDLKVAAMLHDIGKIGISDFVLGKPSTLDEDEMKIIREHPSKGVEILKPIKHFEAILPGILHHHENYDGSGYPAGLAGEDIPLIARIISIADTYDAIMSNRPYRLKRDHEVAMRELVGFAGKQFDPFIVGAFATADAKYCRLFGARGALSSLSTGHNPAGTAVSS